jgi:hypothetical protein
VDEPVDPLGPGYLLDQGEFTTIDVPHLDADETIRGYLRDQQGVYSPIDLPGAALTFPNGINKSDPGRGAAA